MPELEGRFGDFASCLVSEPIGKFQDYWKEIPENSMIAIGESTFEQQPFVF